MHPNFFVIGAAKSGTTSFCALLGQHPDVFMTTPKEPQFFNLPGEAYREKWDWYRSLFTNAGAAKAVGEGSQVYTARPHTGAWPPPRRIHEAFPKARLIYLVRHPVDRIVSNWMMFQRMKPDQFRDFNQDVVHPQRRRWFVDRSRYWFQLSAYREYFPDEQILVLFFDDFVKAPQAVLAQGCTFLGVQPFSHFEDLHRPRNRAPRGYEETRLFSALRRLPGRSFAKQLLPRRLRHRLMRSPLLQTEVETRPHWIPAVRDRVVQELAPDLRQFLSYCGKPHDYWELSA